ncbi:MAG TPA: thioesterase family protein [Noviherbaspirillum sp.]|jgi:acyl-CoA thioester hydrolase|uniref:acyl-CoA thioesterase n=1 Tax=Noviherbaspirillum sp. TaxID=1926288 RepID=UPI002DDCE9C9|nr:thioesterase family protein [Noviherbaspirillum sp.]HEV2613040.1 thioesterase family protein [Noviherbaspirillum sp.]
MSEKKLVHTMRMAIRWGDMDAMGHVNNTVYFRYLESARIDWFTQIGCEPDPAGDGPVIINAHCTFIKQLKYPGDIEVLTYVGPPGRSSFETIQEIRRVDQPEILAAQGGAKVVWVNFPSEKSTPLPDNIKELLA